LEWEREIKITDIITLIWRRKWLIAAFVLIAAVAAYCYSTYYVTPQYTATGTLIVRNAEEKVNTNVELGELNASRVLANTYIEILKSGNFTNVVASDINLNYTASQIRGMLTITPRDETEILEVRVRNTNPHHAAIILNAILNNVDAAVRIVKAGTAIVLDPATVPKAPSSPNIPRNTVLGGFIGALISALIIVLPHIFDITVRDEKEISERYKIPVLGVIPTIKSERN